MPPRTRQPAKLRSLKVSAAFRTFVLDQLEELMVPFGVVETASLAMHLV